MLLSVVAQLLALTLVPGVRADEVECWAPDGKTKGDNDTYVPCNKLGITQNGVYSTCCRLDGDPDERHLCAASGLCLKGGVLLRGYCTDKNWDSPACVNVCTSKSSGGSANGTAEITPCGDNKYCCGRNNLGCCGTEEAFEIPTQASVIADDLTETVVASPSNSPYKAATTGLAVVFGVGALAALGGILWMLRKNKNLRKQLQQLEQSQQEHQPALTDTPGTVQVYPYQPTEGGTEYTGPSSPRQEWGSYKPPTSPSMPEVEGNPQRYSELDGGTATGSVHVYNAPGSPTVDESHVSTPFQSPQQNPQGFQPSQQLQPPQPGQPPHNPAQ